VQTTRPRRTDQDYVNGSPVDYRTPIAERWGGWYRTGKSGPAAHVGNLPLFMAKPEPSTEPLHATVEGRFDLAGYPSPHSDIVALMVLEHQARALNLITRLGWEARVGDVSRVRDAANDLVDGLLFVDEAPIATRIEGSSGFAEQFSAMGPARRQGPVATRTAARDATDAIFGRPGALSQSRNRFPADERRATREGRRFLSRLD
jgi:hypothetical protein